MSQFNPSRIYKQLVELGDDWADKHGAAEMLEETKKTVLAQLAHESGEASQTAKEGAALRHPDYKKHLESMVEARRIANRARVKYDSAKVLAELKRTEAANDRVTLKHAT